MKFLKDRVKMVWNGIFEEMTVAEYISWWVVRLLLIYAVIMHTDYREKVLCAVNTLALFAVPLLHFIAPKKSLIGNLPYRSQHVINLMEICGSFLGNFIFLYGVIPKYDRILHAVSGPAAVVAGYFVYKAILKKEGREKDVSPLLGTVCGMGFSFMIIPLWEITEFFGDFFWGTANQSYWYAPADDDIFYKIFGHGAITDGGQLPLWDTMMDMIDASVTTLVFSLIFYFILRAIVKKQASKSSENKGFESKSSDADELKIENQNQSKQKTAACSAK